MFFSITFTVDGVLSSSIIVLFLFIYIQDVFLYPGTMVRVLSSSIIILFLFIYIQDVFSILVPWSVSCHLVLLYYFYLFTYRMFSLSWYHGRCSVI